MCLHQSCIYLLALPNDTAKIKWLPGNITGVYNAGVFTISGTPDAGVSGTFNYTITTSGGCATASASGTITVNAQIISLTSGIASPSLCNNTVMTSILYTIGGAATNAVLSGAPIGVTGVLVGNVFTVSGTPNDVAGLYTYTITTSGTSCLPVTISGIITVQPAAIGGSISSVSICTGATGTLTLTGQTGTIVRWESSTDGGGTWSPITNTTVTQAYTNIIVPTLYRAVVGNGCGNVFSTNALVNVHNYWTGALSNDWNTAGNWSDGLVPTTVCPDVTIPVVTTVYPLLSAVAPAITNLVIKPGASVTINGGTLQIGGDITKGAGSLFDVTNGSLDFNGTALQSFSGALFVGNTLQNLTVSNTAGITITSGAGNNLNITGVLGFGGVNNATLNTNDNIVLVSTAANTARVSQVINGNHFSGTVTVERYFPASRNWRMFTAPVSGGGSIFDNWQNGGLMSSVAPGKGTLVTGLVAPTPANGFDGPSPNLKTSLQEGVGNQQLVDVANTHTEKISYNAGASADNKPYFIFVRGDRNLSNFSSAVSSNTTLSSQGKLQTGPQTFYTSTVPNSFNMIGNPYASPVDFGKITLNGIAPFLYVWDPTQNLTGSYITFYESSPGVYSSLINGYAGPASGIIQSGQSFYVNNFTGGPASVVFDENAKSTINNQAIFRPMSPAAQMISLSTNLYAFTNKDSIFLADGNLTQFDDSFNPGVDWQDAKKMTNPKETFSLLCNGVALAADRRPLPTMNDTLLYYLTKTTAKKYQFQFVASGLDKDNLAGFINDQFLHTQTPINMNGTTKVNFEVTSSAASAAPNRFMLVFKPSVVYTSLTATVQGSDISVDWNVPSEVNIKNYEVERSSDSIHFTKVGEKASSGNSSTAVGYNWLDVKPALGKYYYRIRSISNNNVTGYSNIVHVKLNRSTPNIYVFPNPVTENTIHLQMNSMPKGVYYVRLINNLGQVIGNSYIGHLAGTSTETIRPNNLMLTGMYQLEITAPDKTTSTIKLFVK